ncbi:QWRF motif-containing protein 7 [Glycine soja]
MDKTASTLSGHHNLMEVPPSPRLVRSRSGSSPAAAITTPERSSHRLSSSQRFTITSVQRSKSTSRTRTTNNERNNINLNPTLTTSVSSKPKNNRVQEKKSRDDGFGKFLQRGVSPDNINVHIKVAFGVGAFAGKVVTWLSNIVSTPAKTNGSDNGNNDSSVGGGVTKVLKYFKQRKVSSVQEEEYHRFRILHNTLLQWRFINARAEVAMANVKNIAEIKLFSVWLRALMLRKITIQKRIELRKVKQLVKLYQILDGQLYLLTEWAQLERRNQESVARLTRKLSALSTILPLTHTVKVDTESVFEALNTAAKVMESIEPLMAKYQTKVERILYQITELTTTLKQEEEYLQKLLGLVPMTLDLIGLGSMLLVRMRKAFECILSKQDPIPSTISACSVAQ